MKPLFNISRDKLDIADKGKYMRNKVKKVDLSRMGAKSSEANARYAIYIYCFFIQNRGHKKLRIHNLGYLTVRQCQLMNY